MTLLGASLAGSLAGWPDPSSWGLDLVRPSLDLVLALRSVVLEVVCGRRPRCNIDGFHFLGMKSGPQWPAGACAGLVASRAWGCCGWLGPAPTCSGGREPGWSCCRALPRSGRRRAADQRCLSRRCCQCGCHEWPAPADLQILGVNLARFHRASDGGAACVITFLEALSKLRFVRDRPVSKDLLVGFFQRCWRPWMSISFLKASLEH